MKGMKVFSKRQLRDLWAWAKGRTKRFARVIEFRVGVLGLRG